MPTVNSNCTGEISNVAHRFFYTDEFVAFRYVSTKGSNGGLIFKFYNDYDTSCNGEPLKTTQSTKDWCVGPFQAFYVNCSITTLDNCENKLPLSGGVKMEESPSSSVENLETDTKSMVDFLEDSHDEEETTPSHVKDSKEEESSTDSGDGRHQDETAPNLVEDSDEEEHVAIIDSPCRKAPTLF